MSPPLTPREMQVAALVGQGKTYHEIAADLAMAPRTVRVHVASIDQKIQGAGATPYRRVMRWALAQRAA